ncbi:MAG: response regulator [Chloroflexota bacterium]
MARILIAEDERDIRELIEFTLKIMAGHDVIAAANGEEAVSLARTEQPDLIMLDMRMPKMTGIEACVALKADDDVKAIPVVFLSAKSSEEQLAAGANTGAIGFINKPFAPDELIARVSEILTEIGMA